MPGVVQIGGVLQNEKGQPLTGTVGVTFALYQDQTTGAALWLETQNVTADQQGRFTAFLGATHSEGLPMELFSTGQARWLGIQAAGQAEQPRMFLASVPYALSAGGLGTAADSTYSTQGTEGSATLDGGSEEESGKGNGTGEPSEPHRPVTELTAGSGIILTPNPITTTGTIEVDPSVFPNLGGENIFVGTQTFEGDVNISGAINGGLVIEPNPSSPNLLGGSPSNSVESDVVGGTIGGGGAAGEPNQVTGDFATIGGGSGNQAGGAPAAASPSFSTARLGDGPPLNTAAASGTGAYSTIGGGQGNDAGGFYSTIGGGASNVALTGGSTVGGGSGNTVSAINFQNDREGENGTIGGGSRNKVHGRAGTIAGGIDNIVTSGSSTVGGGNGNHAGPSINWCSSINPVCNDDESTISGGFGNTAMIHATIGGGRLNEAYSFGTVGGGVGNGASSFGTVGGGRENGASDYATASGGIGNRAWARQATIGGGGALEYDENNLDSLLTGNIVTDEFGTVSGGGNNRAGNNPDLPRDQSDSWDQEDARGATVGGGMNNVASDTFSTVGGGNSNTASGQQSTVGGGVSNTASGLSATVPGGFLNTASGGASFAAGFNAKALNAGTFVWADNSTLSEFASTGDHQFLIRAAGGVGILTNSPTEALDVNGKMKGTELCIGSDCRAAWPAGGGGGDGDITAVNTGVGSGLVGGAASGDANLSLLTSCAEGQLLKRIAGAWVCAVDIDTDTNSGGTVTSVETGNGLVGGPIMTSGVLSIDTTVVPTLNLPNFFQAGQTIFAGAADAKGLVVGGAPGQTANLQEWQDNLGTPLAWVTADGKFVGDGSGLTNLPAGDGFATDLDCDECVSGGEILDHTIQNFHLADFGCAEGETIKWSSGTMLWNCAADLNDGGGAGDITAVNAGTGLTGGGTSGDVTLNVNTTLIQSRVTGTCAAGSSIRVIAADGTVTCETDDGGVGGGIGGSGTANFLPKFADATTLTNSLVSDDGANVTIGVLGGGFRVLGNATTPNIIGGLGNNTVTNGVVGATISGGGHPDVGEQNQVRDDYGTIGGGRRNTTGNGGITTTDAPYATVGGGWGNSATVLATTVAGGVNNSATGDRATVGGGGVNSASGINSTISGGSTNQATAMRATVGGGQGNSATGDAATVSGGQNNVASGPQSTVPGGVDNVAGGQRSFAAGSRAKANHNGSFVWGDLTVADISSTADNQFTARASGGVQFFTSGDLSTGATLAPGSGTWAVVSDRNAKENFAAVNGEQVLERLSAIPMQTWNYKTQEDSIRHMGPMAQDFYAAFGLGPDNKHITTIDADGVALVAIQALYHLSQEEEEMIEQQQTEIDELRTMVEALQHELRTEMSLASK